MENTGKSNLHMVQTDWDEVQEKIRIHRLKRLRTIAIIVGICAALLIACYVFMQHKTYSDYTVTEEITRSDTSATRYISFQDGFVKYSNDGASYVNVGNFNIWNQSYEMENPMVATCGSYIAFADREGDTIYLMDEEGAVGEISVNLPISRIDVASQGNVAVLMEDDGTSYLSLYDKSGEYLAEGAIHVENGGTPIDLALSTNGKLLGVSMVGVTEGVANTTVNFYNFSATGQKEIDNLVSSFSYEDTIIPEITYVSDDTMLAFADNGVYTFTGAETPAEGKQLATSEEIQSVFFDEGYFGLVFADTTKDAGRVIRIYDLKCAGQVTIETEFSYDSISFLDNHEICMFNSTQCKIYTLGGLEKFSYEFDEEISGVFHENGFRNYILLKEGKTERIRLKLFDEITGNEESDDEVLSVRGGNE